MDLKLAKFFYSFVLIVGLSVCGFSAFATEESSQTELSEPKPGTNIFGRRSIYESFIYMVKNGQDISKYVPEYQALEVLAETNASEEKMTAAINALSENYSEDFACKGEDGLFVDQIYGPGPKTQLSNAIENEMRPKWKPNLKSEDIIEVCFTLNPDGSVTDIHDHYKNAQDVSQIDLARAKKFLGTINHPSTFSYPIPLQLFLDDELKKFDIHFTHLCDDLYYFAFERNLQKLFNENLPAMDGRVSVDFQIAPDGKFVIDDIEQTAGPPEFLKSVKDAIAKLPKFRLMPDGAADRNDRTIVFKKGMHPQLDRQDLRDFPNALAVLDLGLKIAKERGVGTAMMQRERDAFKSDFDKGMAMNILAPKMKKLNEAIVQLIKLATAYKDGTVDILNTNSHASPEVGQFMKRLQVAIKKNWQPPKRSVSSKIVVNFELQKSGIANGAKIFSSSGDSAMNAACLLAITKLPKMQVPQSLFTLKKTASIQFSFTYNVNQRR